MIRLFRPTAGRHPALRATLLLAMAAISTTGIGQERQGLEIEVSPVGKAYLTFRGEPLLAFGPADEMRLISGAADLPRWIRWQREHGMNLIRAYPTSVPIEAYGAAGLHPFQQRDGRWDVDAWNQEYFDHIASVAKTLDENDIVLHLQLWQIVWFKNGSHRWDINYLNPKNNVNSWTRALSRGHQYIDAPADSEPRRHQRQWVTRVLDSVKGRSNVIVDVINELGNEMGTLDWAVEVVRWIRQWEDENDWHFLVGVDSEHHYHPDRFGPYQEHFDLIILNELRSREHALGAIANFNMPAVSVRSSDGRNHPRDYMFLNPDSVGPEHQTRYRLLCYRSLMAGLQSIGAYWKPEVDDADYQEMRDWPAYSRALRTFWELIAPHGPLLEPVADDDLDAVTPQVYGLASPRLSVVYLECGSHTHDNRYPESTLRVRGVDRFLRAEAFDPRSGEISPVEATRQGDQLAIQLPAFVDDQAVLIWRDEPSETQ